MYKHMQHPLFVFGLPITILLSMVLLSHFIQFVDYDESFSFAISFDLLITAPLLYLILIWKTNIPKTTVVPFIILGLVIGSYIIPTNNQLILNLFKTWVLPLVELFVLGFVFFKIRKVIRSFKTNKTNHIDFFTEIKKACVDILPNSLIIPFATEIGMFYYGFISWKKRPLFENEFSYHKDSSARAILGVILLVVGVETVALHFLLASWHSTAAWILTIISIYTGFQIFGFLRSLSKRPISIEWDDNKKNSPILKLRYGILSESTINIHNITEIELTTRDIDFDESVKSLSPLGNLEGHNVILHFKSNQTLLGLYGTKKSYQTLTLHLDNKVKFKATIERLQVEKQ